MATFKCNDPAYTVLRNGRVITMSGTPSTAITAIAADAVNVVCPPECCITEVPVTLNTFKITVTTAEFTGLYIRATITHGVDTYSTIWEAAGATNSISLSVLIVEFGAFDSGDTICVEYSYDQVSIIEACCLTVLTDTVLEDDTYQLSDIVRECDGGTFDLEFQDPSMGVTVDADGEMVVPDLDEDGTVYVTFTCDDCITDFLVLSVIEEPVGLRMLFDDIENVPVVDPSNVGQWNTFYDLPTNGAVFTSVVVAGNQVTDVGGGAMTVNQGFASNTNLIEIEDQDGIVDAIINAAFLNATALTDAIFDSAITVGVAGQVGAFRGATSLVNVSLNSATTFSNDNADGTFQGCTSLVNLSLPSAITLASYLLFGATSLETFSAPLATTFGSNGMENCTSITSIDLTSCVNLGNDPTDASVFNGITGQNVTLNIAAVNATNNAGGVHASVAYLIANNTATVNYI